MSTDTTVRTAVVLVHGLFERRPMEIFDAFAKTVLTPQASEWDYHPEPLEVTDSYEARRYVAPSAGTELFEYDWSFLMTNARYAGFAAAFARVFLRRPRHVPDQLFGIWRLTWLALLVPVALLVEVIVVGGFLLHTGVAGWIVGVVSSVVVLTVGFGVLRTAPRVLTRSFLTTGLVNVARYFDPAPESYAARRAIRGGLVDLLSTLHQGRYARIVVVGHGIGGCIAYDALTTLWAEMHELHAGSGPLGVQPDTVGDVQAMQFALWQDLRKHGNPWRTTDFVTLGTPLALADMFVARPPILAGLSRSDSRHELFERLIRRGVVVSCPPEAGQSPFAATRWTNIWFPVRRGGIRGDWFGGVLRPLFGPDIREIAVTGNLPERLRPGAAHSRYFARPDHDADGDVAFHLRAVLALADATALQASIAAPPPDPSTVGRTVHRSWQRSM
jgi:hypothetical protein